MEEKKIFTVILRVRDLVDGGAFVVEDRQLTYVLTSQRLALDSDPVVTDFLIGVDLRQEGQEVH